MGVGDRLFYDRVVPQEVAQFTDAPLRVNTCHAVFLSFLLDDFDAHESTLADLEQARGTRGEHGP